MSAHKLVLTISKDGFYSRLVCPESGCQPAFDADEGDQTCWLKGWGDNMELTECLTAAVEIEVEIEAGWDGDSPEITIRRVLGESGGGG